MPATDLTPEFRRLLLEGVNLSSTQWHELTASKLPQTNPSNSIGKEYINEAYTILNHINTLARMLSHVRRPYLNMDTRNTPFDRRPPRSFDLKDGDPSWSSVKHLTNEERDQIDLQARIILTRCADRVKEMEAIEKRRAELVASKSNPLTRLLPSRLRQDESTLSSDFLAAHRSGVTWYLSRRLAEASQTQKEMQEERVKRQLERTRTLGSGATNEALRMVEGSPSSVTEQQNKRTGSWFGDASAGLITVTSPSDSRLPVPLPSPSSPSDDEDEELELSASQILQFEAENANILQSVRDTLESVQQAESRLMDISALQMELVNHLTRQTELTDQLYEDAIATTATVERGNIQLKEARRRAKDSRLFILVFLIGASLSLLFLHYY